MKKKRNRYRPDRSRIKQRLVLWSRITVGFLMMVSLVLLLSAGLSHSYHALLNASWLRVDEVRIEGLKHLSEGLILDTLGIAKNTSVLDLNVKGLASRLEALPQLRSAVVRLEPPSRIVVELTEREPLALIQADELLLLDKNGKLFSRTTIDESPGILVVTGFSGQGLKQGDFLPREPLDALKELLAGLDAAKGWLPLNLVSECQWRAGGFVLFMARTSIPIQLGSDNFNEKLNRLQRIVTLLADRQWMGTVTNIDLNYGTRAYVGGHFPASKGA